MKWWLDNWARLWALLVILLWVFITYLFGVEWVRNISNIQANTLLVISWFATGMGYWFGFLLSGVYLTSLEENLRCIVNRKQALV